MLVLLHKFIFLDISLFFNLNKSLYCHFHESMEVNVSLLRLSFLFSPIRVRSRMTLATFVILDEQPFKVVEGKGFKHLCR